MSSEDELRKRIDKTLDQITDNEHLHDLLVTILAVTKRERGWCKECNKQVWVDIPDAKAVVSALSELMNQAKGRPEQANSENDEKITLIRREYV